MVHRGQRSLRSQQRRSAKRFILDNSFHDRIMAESISTVTHKAVLTYLGKIYEMVPMFLVNVERGEVLVDSRGRGTFQI